MEDFAHRHVTALSGGELQLVRIARCLVQEAPLVLMDEPTAALDPANSLRVADALVSLARFRQDGALLDARCRPGRLCLGVHGLDAGGEPPGHRADGGNPCSRAIGPDLRGAFRSIERALALRYSTQYSRGTGCERKWLIASVKP